MKQTTLTNALKNISFDYQQKYDLKLDNISKFRSLVDSFAIESLLPSTGNVHADTKPSALQTYIFTIIHDILNHEDTSIIGLFKSLYLLAKQLIMYIIYNNDTINNIFDKNTECITYSMGEDDTLVFNTDSNKLYRHVKDLRDDCQNKINEYQIGILSSFNMIIRDIKDKDITKVTKETNTYLYDILKTTFDKYNKCNEYLTELCESFMITGKYFDNNTDMLIDIKEQVLEISSKFEESTDDVLKHFIGI